MRAVCWQRPLVVSVENVPDPTIQDPTDIIVKVALSSTCGSDLHLYDGYIPTMQPGDIIGHEFVGEVVAVGRDVTQHAVGDRVVVCSIIGCGHCHYCETDQWSLCDNSNLGAWQEELAFGYAGAGIFGYSHLFGGYAGSHAEYIRVPFADFGAVKIPDGVSYENALFVSDAFPTGFQAADFCSIQPGDTVAVWGAGAVGLFAMRSAYMLGAERVVAIDRFPGRMRAASAFGHASHVLNYEEVDIVEALKEITAGRGPDACIEAVGMEAHAPGLPGMYDRVKQTLRLETGRPHALRAAIQACKKGGTVSVIGVFAGLIDKIPMGAAFNKALTLRMGQQHGQRYMPQLMQRVANGEIEPARVITHRMALEQAQEGYEIFKHKVDECLRVVFDPSMQA